jgi:hypothetical protein
MSELASESSKSEASRAISPVLAVLAWVWVLVPFGYGLYQLLIKIPALFGS